MAKIAVELERALALRAEGGARGEATRRVLAQGDGWAVADVLCTAGPHDRRFEEQHSSYTISMVTTGTFQYRGHKGCELMSPGSLFLGNAGEYFECGHEHGAGDHCLAFWYTPEYFEQLAADAGARKLGFPVLRLPALRELAWLSARAMAALNDSTMQTVATSITADAAWEEIGLALAARVIRLAGDRVPAEDAPPSTIARVTRVVRMIEREPDADLAVSNLARLAGLSPYHFLRTFERLTGLTPHQYILRARLHQAALRLAAGPAKIVDIALDSGFKDVSNFNRAFRTEFGASPRAFRAQAAVRTVGGPPPESGAAGQTLRRPSTDARTS